MKLALVGYGKMGRAVETVAMERGHDVVAKIDPTLGTGDVGVDTLAGAEVAIEFSVPALWYAMTSWLLLLTIDLKTLAWDLPDWSMTVALMATAVGFPLALGIAWAFDITPHGIRRAQPRAPAEDSLG